MPSYFFQCDLCGHEHEVVLKMSEYDAFDKTCSQGTDNDTRCGGKLVQTYENRETQNFILLGGGWTGRLGPINRG